MKNKVDLTGNGGFSSEMKLKDGNRINGNGFV